MNKKKLLIIVALLLLVTPLTVVAYTNSADELPIYVRPKSAGQLTPNTAYNYEFVFTNDPTCQNSLLNITTTITTDAYGVGYTSLDISPLNNDSAKYMCEYRNGPLRAVHQLEGHVFDHFEQDVDVQGSGFFNFLGSLIDRIEKLFVKDIDASGNIAAANYTLDGTTINSWNDIGVSKIVGFTSASYNGDLTNGSLYGYAAANAICDQEYSGSHFCLKSEVLHTIAEGNYSFSGTAWFQNGPPGYTANADDCSGWTTSSSDYLGPFWNWDANAQAGKAVLTNCAQQKPLMCCGGN